MSKTPAEVWKSAWMPESGLKILELVIERFPRIGKTDIIRDKDTVCIRNRDVWTISFDKPDLEGFILVEYSGDAGKTHEHILPSNSEEDVIKWTNYFINSAETLWQRQKKKISIRSNARDATSSRNQNA